VMNPFVNRHAEEVSDPSLIQKDTRETEWSDPTKAVYVPEDSRFFVVHVADRPGRSSLPWAQVDLYEWFASTGTVVNKQPLLVSIGQLLGGLQIADVLNPAEGNWDKEKVPFTTNDALVDVASGFSLDTTLHGDLLTDIAAAATKDKAEPGDKKSSEKAKTGTMVPDILVFVDGNGALRIIDGLDQEEDHQKEKQRYNFQKGQWEELTNPQDEEKPGRRGMGGRMGGGRKSKRGRTPTPGGGLAPAGAGY
ncbi:MAG TPA: hypothetical protein VEI07_01205, partial [Planctomycetaceae bacterium]|nr:hypothetical protein [Planctomycetaceae bacterium]